MPINFKKWIAAFFITAILCASSTLTILKLDDQSEYQQSSSTAYQYVDPTEEKYAESYEPKDESKFDKVKVAPNDLLPANTFVTIVDHSDVDAEFENFDPSDSSLETLDFDENDFDDPIADLDFASPTEDEVVVENDPIDLPSEIDIQDSEVVVLDENVESEVEAVLPDEEPALDVETSVVDADLETETNDVVEEEVVAITEENDDAVAETAIEPSDVAEEPVADALDQNAFVEASHVAPAFVWGTKDSVDSNGVVLFSEEGVDLKAVRPTKSFDPPRPREEEATEDVAAVDDEIEFDSNEVVEGSVANDVEDVAEPIANEIAEADDEIEFDSNEIVETEPVADEIADVVAESETIEEGDEIEFDSNEVVEAEPVANEIADVVAETETIEEGDEIEFDSNEVVEAEPVANEIADVVAETETIEEGDEIEFDSNEVVEAEPIANKIGDVVAETETIEEGDEIEFDSNEAVEAEPVADEIAVVEEASESEAIEEGDEIAFDSNDVVEEETVSNEESYSEELTETEIVPVEAEEATDETAVENEIEFDSNDVTTFDAATDAEEVEAEIEENETLNDAETLSESVVDDIYSETIQPAEDADEEEGEENQENQNVQDNQINEENQESNLNEQETIQENNAELERAASEISCAVLYDSNNVQNTNAQNIQSIDETELQSSSNNTDNENLNEANNESLSDNEATDEDVAVEIAKQLLYDSNAVLIDEMKATDVENVSDVDALDEADAEGRAAEAADSDVARGMIKSVSYVFFSDEQIAAPNAEESEDETNAGEADDAEVESVENLIEPVPAGVEATASGTENSAASGTLWENDVGTQIIESRPATQDEFWVVQPSGGSRICWRYESGQWIQTPEAEFFKTDDPERATIIWAHGYKTDMTSATNGGFELKRAIDDWRASYGVDRKARVVVWKWASEKTGARIAADAWQKKELAVYYGAELGKFVGRLNPQDDVALIGFSFGALVVGSALQTMATTDCNYLKAVKEPTGFATSGEGAVESAPSAKRTRGRIALALVSAACDQNAFGRGGEFARGAQLPSVVISLYNPRDEALRLYPVVANGSAALGVAPTPSESFTGTGGMVYNIDVSGVLKKKHSFEHSLRAAPASHMIQTVL